MARDRSGRVRLAGRCVAAAGLVAVGLLGAEWLRLSTAGAVDAGPAIGPVPGGSLVIAGGGRLAVEAGDTFFKLAGGSAARIVVIPTAHRSADAPDTSWALAPWTARGTATVEILHTRSRPRADDPAFAGQLADATGVWISGGDQEILAQVYAGTEVERQLQALLARGGVIGGTSAGAAVMTRRMIGGGRPGASLGRGLDLLPRAVVDQHCLRRNRVARLFAALEGEPDLVGLGVDESTALVVTLRDGRLRVVGDSYVVALVPPAPGRPARIEILKHGDQTDLASLRLPDRPIIPAVDFDALASELP